MVADEPNYEKMREVMQVVENDDRSRRQAWTITGSKHLQQCDIPYMVNSLTLLLSLNSWSWTRRSAFAVHDLTAALSLQFIYKFLGKFTSICNW